jgi:hypothetical protein
MTEPVFFNAELKIEQQLSLANGWNWISFHTRAADMSVKNVFAPVREKTTLLKNAATFTMPHNAGWSAGLDSIRVGSMYKAKMSEQVKLKLTGDKLNPENEAVSIVPKWNWIGYIPVFSLPLGDALADLNPRDGDLIKGQTQFAVYDGAEWMGSLKTLAPGRGYLYNSKDGASKQFTYPSEALAYMRASTAPAELHFTPVPASRYPGNMNIIARVKDGDQTLTNVEVGIFAGDECRGAEAATAEGLVFLTVAGDESVPLQIKVFIRDTNETIDCTQTLTYIDDAIIGHPENPYEINLSTLGMEDVQAARLAVYPNPVRDRLYVMGLSEETEVKVADMFGRILIIENLDAAGNKLDVSSLPQGAYTISVGRKVMKFVKL